VLHVQSRRLHDGVEGEDASRLPLACLAVAGVDEKRRESEGEGCLPAGTGAGHREEALCLRIVCHSWGWGWRFSRMNNDVST
jgi:hypothetical protein